MGTSGGDKAVSKEILGAKKLLKKFRLGLNGEARLRSIWGFNKNKRAKRKRMVKLAETMRKKLFTVVNPFDWKTVRKFVEYVRRKNGLTKNLDKDTKTLWEKVQKTYTSHKKKVFARVSDYNAGRTRGVHEPPDGIHNTHFQPYNQTEFLDDLKCRSLKLKKVLVSQGKLSLADLREIHSK